MDNKLAFSIPIWYNDSMNIGYPILKVDAPLFLS